MRLAGRVGRLEREGRGGACPRCGGVRPLVVVYNDDPEPAPCPGCGREPHAVRYVRPGREPPGPGGTGKPGAS